MHSFGLIGAGSLLQQSFIPAKSVQLEMVKVKIIKMLKKIVLFPTSDRVMLGFWKQPLWK